MRSWSAPLRVYDQTAHIEYHANHNKSEPKANALNMKDVIFHSALRVFLKQIVQSTRRVPSNACMLNPAAVTNCSYFGKTTACKINENISSIDGIIVAPPLCHSGVTPISECQILLVCRVRRPLSCEFADAVIRRATSRIVR